MSGFLEKLCKRFMFPVYAMWMWKRQDVDAPMPDWFPETLKDSSPMLGGKIGTAEDWEKLDDKYGAEEYHGT